MFCFLNSVVSLANNNHKSLKQRVLTVERFSNSNFKHISFYKTSKMFIPCNTFLGARVWSSTYTYNDNYFEILRISIQHSLLKKKCIFFNTLKTSLTRVNWFLNVSTCFDYLKYIERPFWAVVLSCFLLQCHEKNTGKVVFSDRAFQNC